MTAKCMLDYEVREDRSTASEWAHVGRYRDRPRVRLTAITAGVWLGRGCRRDAGAVHLVGISGALLDL